MTKRKTLVILTPAFPENEADSNWLPAHHQMVKAIKKQFPGIGIVVLTFLYPHRASHYDWNGIRVVSFNGMNAKGYWKRLQLWRKIWSELRRVRREYKVIGLFSFWCGECAFIGHYFGLLASIRHRCWISGGDAKQGNKWVKRIRPKGRELIAVSNYLRQLFRENYGIEPASVIPNGIDAAIFANGESDATRDIDILAVGSLVPLKQYEVLVRVVAALTSQFPQLKAVHCGGGEERDRLQSLIVNLGLEQNLNLLGEIPHADVLGWMQRAKVFLHPSSSEGYSTVCLEALYAGARVISFCDPADKQVPEWLIVKDETEMITKSRLILTDPPEGKPVLLHSLEDNARSVMKLFISNPLPGTKHRDDVVVSPAGGPADPLGHI
jgi:glycosyltransferase involved in cell wall biosynthesis